MASAFGGNLRSVPRPGPWPGQRRLWFVSSDDTVLFGCCAQGRLCYGMARGRGRRPKADSFIWARRDPVDGRHSAPASFCHSRLLFFARPVWRAVLTRRGNGQRCCGGGGSGLLAASRTGRSKNSRHECPYVGARASRFALPRPAWPSLTCLCFLRAEPLAPLAPGSPRSLAPGAAWRFRACPA